MKPKTKGPKKHSGDHSSILGFLCYCIEQGDDTYEKAAWRIHDNEWMSPTSKTGSDFAALKQDCKRTWDKACQSVEMNEGKPTKKLKNFERLRMAREWVDFRVEYDTFLGQYLADGVVTSPAAEFDGYNSQADENSFIEKPYFVNAFEVDRMKRISALKTWADNLPIHRGKVQHIQRLSSFIPAIDPAQAELYLTGWLIRAYIQAVNPFDQDANAIVNRWMLILHQQRQDSGKSGFFRWLSPDPAWVKENGLEDNKDGYIALARYMFVLDDELGGLSRVTQHERIKSMISTSKIDVRPPYGKVDIKLQRTASFCGSTNNTDIFPSAEGTTRFLVLPLTEQVFDWKKYVKQVDRDKLWAEVKYLATTDWLDKHNDSIVKYRSDTNTGFIREDMESFIVERYIRAAPDGPIMRAGDIMRILCGTDYGYNNLNISRFGQALRKAFGERVNGYAIDGQRCKGYNISVLPADDAPESLRHQKTGKTEDSPTVKLMKAKRRRTTQR
jgi:hypothetical protein